MIKKFEVTIEEEKDILAAGDIFAILQNEGLNVKQVILWDAHMLKKPSLEEELLKKIEEAPNGSFIKAWGYSMYGICKAIESTSKR